MGRSREGLHESWLPDEVGIHGDVARVIRPATVFEHVEYACATDLLVVDLRVTRFRKASLHRELVNHDAEPWEAVEVPFLQTATAQEIVRVEESPENESQLVESDSILEKDQIDLLRPEDSVQMVPRRPRDDAMVRRAY